MAESYPNGRKDWEMEKLLVMSNFCFSHNVFKRLVSQGHQRVSLYGNGLTLKMPFTKIVAFAASVDQDQAAQDVQPDLRSTLSAMLEH